MQFPAAFRPPVPPLQAARLTMVQILMAARGLALNPLQSLYYVSPACFACLLVPFCEWAPGAGVSRGGVPVACCGRACTWAPFRMCC